MRWQCQLCLTQGREDSWKSMGDFGVRCPADFVSRLLVQGAWSRCGACTSAQRAERLHEGGQRSNAERQAGAALRTRVCRTCSEDLPKESFWPADWRHSRSRDVSCKSCQQRPPDEREAAPLASAASHACGTCGQDRRRCEYWPQDWDNRLDVRRQQSISCRVCQPLPPNAREVGRGHLNEALRRQPQKMHLEALARKFVCGLCHTEKVRTEFWPTDVNNRFLYTLGCKQCKPIPPNERRRSKRKDQA